MVYAARWPRHAAPSRRPGDQDARFNVNRKAGQGNACTADRARHESPRLARHGIGLICWHGMKSATGPKAKAGNVRSHVSFRGVKLTHCARFEFSRPRPEDDIPFRTVSVLSGRSRHRIRNSPRRRHLSRWSLDPSSRLRRPLLSVRAWHDPRT